MSLTTTVSAMFSESDTSSLFVVRKYMSFPALIAERLFPQKVVEIISITPDDCIAATNESPRTIRRFLYVKRSIIYPLTHGVERCHVKL